MVLTPDSAFQIRVVELPHDMIQLLLLDDDLLYSRRALTREGMTRTCGRSIRITKLATRVPGIRSYAQEPLMGLVVVMR